MEESTTSESIYNPYFGNPDIDYVYKMGIAIYGNEFSGILIIKKIEAEKHRMVFTSQFGNTLFDIEFTKDGHKVITILDDLNKKIILNTLTRDFSLLVKENGTVINGYQNMKYNVLRERLDKRSNYYFYAKADEKLIKIVNVSRSKEKFEIRFNKITEGLIAENIIIDHKNIKLKIELNVLKN